MIKRTAIVLVVVVSIGSALLPSLAAVRPFAYMAELQAEQLWRSTHQSPQSITGQE
jgi:hypothetical protein